MLLMLDHHMLREMQLEERLNMLRKPLRIELKLEKHKEKLKLELLESMPNLRKERNLKNKEKT